MISADPAVPAAAPAAGLKVPRLGAPAVHSLVLLLALMAWLLATSNKLLDDPDSLWHVAIGQWIWTHRALPSTDLFSHTFHGAPWIAKEWLSQLVFFAAHSGAGWLGVVLVTALTIACAFAMMHLWLAQRLDATAALALTLIALMLAQPHFLARPHVLVMPIIVAWMVGLVSALERRSAPPLRLAVLMVLWANMHGSFPLGLVMAGVLAGEGVLRRPYRLANLWPWARFLAVAAAATCVSPYGWHAIVVPLQMAGNGDTLRYVQEWQPLGFDGLGLMAFAALALALFALASDAKARVFRIIAVGLLAILMVRHGRFVSVFGLVTPILVAGALARRFKPAERPAPSSMWPVAFAALVVLVLVATVRPVPNVDVAPEAAFRAALTANVSGPVYNDYDFGGYLIAQNVQTFVDGRTDQLFLHGFLPALSDALTARGDQPFADLLARFHVTWALVKAHSLDAGHLATMSGWSRIYGDETAEVFIRR